MPWDEPAVWGTFDAAVIRSTWDYVDHLEAFERWLDVVASATVLLNPAQLVRWNLRKRYLIDLAARGVPTVPTELLPQRSAAPDLPRRCSRKRASSSSSQPCRSTRSTPPRTHDEALTAHLDALLRVGDVLVQPFVPSVLDRGEVSLLYFGGCYSHAIRKIAKAGDYRVQEHHGGSVVDHEPASRELALADSALAAAPVVPVYAHVDIVETDDGPRLMELELIEPTLFLDAPGAADRFADVVCQEARRRPRAI